jgi:predicted permease
MLRELRRTLRILCKDWSFTCSAVLTLAICLGAHVTMLSIVRSVVLKPLPIPDSDRVMLVYNSYPNAGTDRFWVGISDYFDRLQGVPAFVKQALYRRRDVTLMADGASRLSAVRATPSFYTLLRVEPVIGRVFTTEEGEEEGERAVVLSYGFWQRQFGGDPLIATREIRIDGEAHRIIGVMPSGFKFLWDDVDVWLPLIFTPQQKADRGGNNSYSQIALLAPGATRELAQAQVDAINAHNDHLIPASLQKFLHDAGFHTVVVPLNEHVVRDIRPILLLLWGGVWLVLLIGCVNISNLELVRATVRAHEFAVRRAIGAGRARLAGLVMAETLFISTAGGVLGLLCGWLMVHALTSLHLERLPRGFEIRMDMVDFVISVMIAAGAGMVIGLVPVWRVSALDLTTALRDHGPTLTTGRGAAGIRSLLATVQVALAFVLVVGAGLLIASLREIVHIDPGFQSSSVLTAVINLQPPHYPDNSSVVTFTNRLLEGIRSLPGVESAGATDGLPMGSAYSETLILAEGYQMQPGESFIAPHRLVVSDGYFEAMRVPLERGRYFSATDTAGSPPVVVVDERLANRFWPGGDPIGRHLYRPGGNPDNLLAIGPYTAFITVVGVVREVRLDGLVSDRKTVGAYYYPLSQQPSGRLSLAIRTRGTPEAMIAPLRKSVAMLDATLPVFQIMDMTARVDDWLIGRRVPVMLATAFGGVALLLAAIGTYGVLSYGVVQRRREIGMRMVLGSTTGGVFRFILREGVYITGIGVGVGFGVAVAGGRIMSGMLYGVRPADPHVIGIATVVMCSTAFMAIAVPALAASHISPAEALGER